MANEGQDLHRHLLDLQQQQLDAIGCGDYEAYKGLCHPQLTCFEPEAKGHLVEGMEFHKTYFKHKAGGAAKVLCNTISSPKIQLLGGEENPAAAIVTYVRLIQVLDDAGKHATMATQETRVWERVQPPWSGQPWGEWVNVHLHRSPAA